MATLPAMRFLDAKMLRSLTNLELAARLLVEGMYASRHRCPTYGYSVEFVDHREYAPGDEPRTIDWKMLGRTEKYFVKRFEMESNMNVVSLVDVSGSMGYRGSDGGRLSKLEYASYLSAALSYLVKHQQDSPGLVTFDEGIRDFIPPKQGQRHLFTILATLEGLAAREGTDISQVLRLIAQRLTRRGVVVLISDCHGKTDEVIEGIRQIVARGHELILFHLLDEDEVSFPFKALTSFKDMESRVEVMSDPIRLRKLYLERLAGFQAEVKAGCASAGADYRFISTAEPMEVVLRDYLLYRRQRGR